MWPYPNSLLSFDQNMKSIASMFDISQNEKTIDAFTHKLRRITLDVAEIQVDTASKLFGLANKHTDNLFGLYTNVFNNQLIDYRNTIHSICKE